MKNFNENLINNTTTIKETIKTIDEAVFKIALVINDENLLLGVVTDGDIRRGILRGLSLDSSVENVMNKTPTTSTATYSDQHLQELMKSKEIDFIPIIDDMGHVIDLISTKEVSIKKENAVFILAGGLGKRLGKLTKDCPKPMLKLGNKPILQNIIEQLKNHGHYRFYISVNYKSEVIKDYFKDGKELGIEITYIHEDQPLGTAGSLKFIDHETHPIIVMNGDVLTSVNFEALLNFHNDLNAQLTICCREYIYQIPYGVIETNNSNVISINEKPDYKFKVNAGIYAISPSTLSELNVNEKTDMTTLIDRLLSKKKKVVTFPIHEYWLDIGQVQEFEKAQTDYKKIF